MDLDLAVAIPGFGFLGVLVGMAAAALSLTSWAILLPILMVWGKLDVYNALFICFSVDFINGIFVAWRYIDRVDKRGAVVIALIAVAAAVEVAMSFGKRFVFDNQKLLQAGVGYGDFLGGAIFLFRGWNTRHKNSLADDKLGAAYADLADGALDEPLACNSIGRKFSQASSIGNRHSSLVVCDTLAEEADVPPVFLLDMFSKPLERADIVKLGIVFLGSALVGAICGVIGFGAGTIFMLMYILVLRSTTLEGAGTGSLVMAILMLSMLIVYADEVDLTKIWKFLAIILPCDIFGAQLASHYAVQLTESKLSFAICILLWFIGTFMTVASHIHAVHVSS